MYHWIIHKLSLVLLLVPGFALQAAEQILDQEYVEVCMDVAVRARIKGLKDFDLETSSSDGSPGARYTGSENFEVESNAPVRLVVSGADLSNGAQRLSTSYSIDGDEDFIETGPGTHNGSHTLRARTRLGDISDQLAGQYSAGVSITVIPLVSSVRSCKLVKRKNESQKPKLEESTAEATLTVPETTKFSEPVLTPAQQLEAAVQSLDPTSEQQLQNFAQQVINSGNGN